jgi:hypothetical protein
MDRSRVEAIKLVEDITKDLRRIQSKINLLEDHAGFQPAERALVTSLANALRGVRGYHLGELRVKAGMGIG